MKFKTANLEFLRLQNSFVVSFVFKRSHSVSLSMLSVAVLQCVQYVQSADAKFVTGTSIVAALNSLSAVTIMRRQHRCVRLISYVRQFLRI